MPDNYFNYADGLSSVNNALGAYNNSEKMKDYHARGAHQLLSINTDQTYASNLINTIYTGAGGPGSVYDLYVKFKVTEPLMLSPFIFSHEKQNSQGFYGVQNMNFRMNINGQNLPVTSMVLVAGCQAMPLRTSIFGFTARAR